MSMCLSTVVRVTDGGSEELLTQVAGAKVHGDTVTFTDLLGVETEVHGTITDVDLIDNKIYLTS